MRVLVARRPLTAYLVLAVVPAWIAWLPLILGRNGLRIINQDVPVAEAILGPFVGPLLAAIAVSAAIGGGSAVRALMRRMVTFRGAWGSLLVAVLVPVLVNLVAGLAVGAGSGSGPGDRAAVLSFPVTLVVTLIVGGPLGEEPGWRGFLYPQLAIDDRPAWLAAVQTGVIWSLWHLPLLLFVPSWRSDVPVATYLPAYVVTLTSVTVVLVWLMNRSEGSLVPPLFGHAALNAAGAFLSIALTDRAAEDHATALTLVTAALYLATAIGVVTLTRGRLSEDPSGSRAAVAPAAAG